MRAFHQYEKRPPGRLRSSAFKLQQTRVSDMIIELRINSVRTAFVSIDTMLLICYAAPPAVHRHRLLDFPCRAPPTLSPAVVLRLHAPRRPALTPLAPGVARLAVLGGLQIRVLGQRGATVGLRHDTRAIHRRVGLAGFCRRRRSSVLVCLSINSRTWMRGSCMQ